MGKYTQEQIVNYLKTYGFVYPDSEIYGGLANAWDYGPLGVLLKNNIKKLWWREFVTKQPNALGLDCAIINNPKTYEASGHLSNFSDPLMDCKACRERFRVDKLIEENVPGISVSEATSLEELTNIVKENHIKCPSCGKEDWTSVRRFNLMFKTFIGVTEDAKNTVYLRPETCQPIFTNFSNVLRTCRPKLPFSLCQIGKSFRNEITPGNFIFRTREFEQMEIEYFTYPERSMEDFDMWIKRIHSFLEDLLQMDPTHFNYHEIPDGERAFYSKKTIDIEYQYPFGLKELWGCAHRGTHDLSSHMRVSEKDLTYLEPDGKRITPEVVEPSVGCDRLLYALVCEKYEKETLENGEEREVLKLIYELAPYKCAILPLGNKLNDKAREVFNKIIDRGISASFDTSGSIGKRYRRADAIGTFYCITIDFDTENDNCVTIRDRDTMKQERVKIDDLFNYLK